MQWWVRIIHVEVSVGGRSHFVIRIVILTDFNISSRIKSTAEQYSVVRGMFTSRSTGNATLVGPIYQISFGFREGYYMARCESKIKLD